MFVISRLFHLPVGFPAVHRHCFGIVLQEVARSNAVQFVILFRDAAMQYRGLYTYNPDDTSPDGEILLTKIHGTGPKQLSSKVMEKFFK